MPPKKKMLTDDELMARMQKLGGQLKFVSGTGSSTDLSERDLKKALGGVSVPKKRVAPRRTCDDQMASLLKDYQKASKVFEQSAKKLKAVEAKMESFNVGGSDDDEDGDDAAPTGKKRKQNA